MSKYFGVSKRNGKYRARITVDGKTHSLGTFTTAQDAAMEYDNAVRRFRGADAARLNFPGLKVIDSKLLSLKEPVWTSSDGRRTPISLLANNHLLNIERMLRYRGARIPAEGTQAHWYMVIANELSKRGLEPLIDHPNQVEETVEVPVYSLANNRRKLHNGYATIDITSLPLALKYTWFDHGYRVDGKQHTPVAVIDTTNAATTDTHFRHLDSFITGNIKHPIIHRNGNPRDCTRKNLFVDAPKAIYKVGTDSQRTPSTPQGVSNDRPKPRVTKGEIRARLDSNV